VPEPLARDIPRDTARDIIAEVDARIARLSPAALALGDPCGCDEQCDPCDRCRHPECEHHDARGCQTTGCTCMTWLSASDCEFCSGSGDTSIDHELAGGRVIDADVPCPWCRGTGGRIY
jgi:hypothetical protein